MTARLRTFPVMTCKPSQGLRCRSGLYQGLPFAAVSPCVPLARADLHPPRKVDVKNLAHRSFLSIAAHVERHLVTST